MGGDDLLWRQAAALACTTNARAENEDGLPRDDRRYQAGMNSAGSLPSPSRKTRMSASLRTAAMPAWMARP